MLFAKKEKMWKVKLRESLSTISHAGEDISPDGNGTFLFVSTYEWKN